MHSARLDPSRIGAGFVAFALLLQPGVSYLNPHRFSRIGTKGFGSCNFCHFAGASRIRPPYNVFGVFSAVYSVYEIHSYS